MYRKHRRKVLKKKLQIMLEEREALKLQQERPEVKVENFSYPSSPPRAKGELPDIRAPYGAHQEMLAAEI